MFNENTATLITWIVNIAWIITPIVIGLGFFFAYRQLVATRNARMAEIILSITQQWDSPQMELSRRMVDQCGRHLRERIEEEEGKPDSEDLRTLVRVANFFDSLGLLIMEGFLSCSMTYKLFGRAEEHFYNAYRSILEEPRYKEYFKYFVELHQAFTKEEARLSKKKPPPIS